MTQPLRTCTHINDTGRICDSVAAKDQKYCPHHLHYRARQLRLAQARARAERFDIKLPPLEDMYAVQSALAQLAEALAADMIDLKRAHALMSVLRLMSLNFRHPEKWQANLYHSDHPAEVDVAKEYGLPRDLDHDTPPEVAFPESTAVAPPAGAPDERRFSARWGGLSPSVRNCGDLASDNWLPTTDNSSAPADADFRLDFPISPDWLEVRDVTNTQGSDAAQVRCNQLERNRARRQLRSSRKRYVDIAMRLNLKRAAERLAESKLSEKLAQLGIAPPAVDAQPVDFDTAVAQEMKKAAATTAEIDACLAGQEVKIA
jgi:hypothetical protein